MDQDSSAWKSDAQNQLAGWLSEMLLIDGEEYFSALLHQIQIAEKSIYIETYILEKGVVTTQLFDALGRAVRRGVRVCLLVDGIGSAHWIANTLSQLQFPPFEVRVFHPLPWQILPQLNKLRLSAFSKLSDLIGVVNRRDHRKMVLIDEKVAFVGSLNWSDVHWNSQNPDASWHDVAIRVESEDCESLKELFLGTWYRSWRICEEQGLRPPSRKAFRSRRKPHPMILRNDYRFIRFRAYSWRLKQIASAQTRVWIANAYFVPSRGMLRALMRAASRGVDVRILLTAESDVHFMPWIARTYYAALSRSGVRLFEYQPRILHSKVIFIDDYAIIGSSNLNHRSLLHDLELDVLVKEFETVRRIHRMFEDDFLDSVEMESESLSQISFWQELVVKVLLNFRQIL